LKFTLFIKVIVASVGYILIFSVEVGAEFDFWIDDLNFFIV